MAMLLSDMQRFEESLEVEWLKAKEEVVYEVVKDFTPLIGKGVAEALADKMIKKLSANGKTTVERDVPRGGIRIVNEVFISDFEQKVRGGM